MGAGLVRPCRIAKIPLVVHFHGYDACHRRTLEKYQKDYQEMFRSLLPSSSSQKRCPSKWPDLAHLGKKFTSTLRHRCVAFCLHRCRQQPATLSCDGAFCRKEGAPFDDSRVRTRSLQCHDIRLSLAGDGPLLDRCKQLVRALRLEEVVEFLGVVSHDRVPTTMRRFRGFVQHSVTAPSGDSEGSPIAVMEAGASASVVSTKHEEYLIQ